MKSRALLWLDRHGVPYQVLEYDEVEKTAQEVALKCRLPLDRVFKTLLIHGDNGFAIVLMPGTEQLSEKKCAAAMDCRRVEMADPEDIQRITGYLRGSVSPINPRRPVPVFCHQSILENEHAGVSAGQRGFELWLKSSDLVRATSATILDCAR
ncbi:MAG: aminoacyl-tRNA deacylase [Sulfobacillus sp.]